MYCYGQLVSTIELNGYPLCTSVPIAQPPETAVEAQTQESDIFQLDCLLFPSEGFAAVTTTLISENFSMSKKSAERKMLVALPVMGVQRRGSDVEPAGHRAGVGNPRLAPDLGEMALDGHQAPHRLVPECEGRAGGIQIPNPTASWLLRSVATVDISSLTLSQSYW